MTLESHALQPWEYVKSLPQTLPEFPENESTGLQAELERVQSTIDGIGRAKARAFDAYVRELTDELTYVDTKKRLESEEKSLQDRLHLIRLQIAQDARKRPTEATYQHVRDVGEAMLKLGETEQKRVNAWLREYVKVEFNQDRELSAKFA